MLPGASPNYLGNIQGLDRGPPFDTTDTISHVTNEIGPYPYQGGQAQGPLSRSVDDFGVTNQPSRAGGGRFVTFPVKSNRPAGGSGLARNEGAPPTLGYPSRHEQTDSFSSSIVAAMGSEDIFSDHQTRRGSDNPIRLRRSLDGDTNPLAYVPPLGRLPGNPWKDTDTNENSSQEETQLAYMRSLPDPMSDKEGSQGGGGERHTRFGHASNVSEDLERGERGEIMQYDHVDGDDMRGWILSFSL